MLFSRAQRVKFADFDEEKKKTLLSPLRTPSPPLSKKKVTPSPRRGHVMSRSVLVPLSCCACSSSSRCSGRSQTEGRPLCPNWREPTNSALRRRRRIPFGSSEDFAALSQPSVSPRRPSLSRLQVQLARIMLRILDARGRERSKKGTKPSGTKRQFAQQQQKNMAALALLLTSFAALSLSLFLSLFPPSLFPLSFLSLSSSWTFINI